MGLFSKCTVTLSKQSRESWQQRGAPHQGAPWKGSQGPHQQGAEPGADEGDSQVLGELYPLVMTAALWQRAEKSLPGFLSAETFNQPQGPLNP